MSITVAALRQALLGHKDDDDVIFIDAMGEEYNVACLEVVPEWSAIFLCETDESLPNAISRGDEDDGDSPIDGEYVDVTDTELANSACPIPEPHGLGSILGSNEFESL